MRRDFLCLLLAFCLAAPAGLRGADATLCSFNGCGQEKSVSCSEGASQSLGQAGGQACLWAAVAVAVATVAAFGLYLLMRDDKKEEEKEERRKTKKQLLKELRELEEEDDESSLDLLPTRAQLPSAAPAL